VTDWPDGVPLGDQPEAWTVLRSEPLYRDAWVVGLRADWVTRPGHPDGEPFRRLVLEHPGAVVVLAVDADERVLVLHQYRHPAQRRFVELPAGLLDAPGEDPEAAARRELAEETGYEAGTWLRLATTYSSPGISTEVMHLFLARDLSPVDRGDFTPEHEEADMTTSWVGSADLLAAVLAGRVQDAPVLNAVLLAHARGLIGR
jgi:8-oxo-dGTP pyrophosphatase MutT (NUDIX family)